MKISCEPKNIRLMEKGNTMAMASITLDDAFVVSGLKVMNGSKGLFVDMPSAKGKDQNGNVKYYDTAFPLSKELRGDISKTVLDAYQGKLNERQNSSAQNNGETPQQAGNAQETEDEDLEYPF